MTSSNDTHTAVFNLRFIYRQPHRDNVHRLKRLPPVDTILMPRDRHTIVFAFTNKMARPEHNIRSDKPLYNFQYPRMRQVFEQERVLEMWDIHLFRTPALRQIFNHFVHIIPERIQLRVCEDASKCEISVFFVKFSLLIRDSCFQLPIHSVSPFSNFIIAVTHRKIKHNGT